jgi:hypothetical protein
MLRNEIRKRNEEIAKMLNYRMGKDPYLGWWFNGSRGFKRLVFNSNWEQLMYAVNFIESIKIPIPLSNNEVYECFIFTIINNKCTIKSTMRYSDIITIKPRYEYYDIQITNCKKQSIFIIVSNFAKFYNNTIKSCIKT